MDKLKQLSSPNQKLVKLRSFHYWPPSAEYVVFFENILPSIHSISFVVMSCELQETDYKNYKDYKFQVSNYKWNVWLNS